MNIPDEAVFAAAKAITGPLRDPTEWELEQFKRSLTAALPFLQGVKPGSLVNDANIIASDMPHTVVKKLDAAYETRILSAIEASVSDCECTKIQQDESCPVGYPSLLCEICDGKGVAPSPRAQALEEEAFQHRVKPWMLACFGEEISNDKLERCDRFIEEALELVQAIGYSADRAHALVDYVFNRDIGEPHQEVGGVMVTLAALCLASGLDMNKAGEDELARIWTKVEKIRAKQAAKPTGSALPIALSSHPVANALPQDVINLVIAARDAFDAISGCGIGAEIEADLDKALKAFASRVPYENEPDALPASPGASE